MWGRTRIQQAARELADHLGMIETIKALQTVQKELADAHRELKGEVRELQAELMHLVGVADHPRLESALGVGSAASTTCSAANAALLATAPP